jgi:ABC-2 type transport system ATP-binding protein
LLGDPATVILDEPANGLDPEGIRWIRNLLKGLAAEGRTVFLSSHLMSEMEQTAEHLIVIGRGRLIADTDVASFVSQASSGAPVRVRAAQPAVLAEALAAGGGRSERLEGEALQVFGLSSEQIGEIAAAQQLVLHELTPMQVSLEDAFMDLTKDSLEYQHLENSTTGTSAVGAGA